MTNTPMIISHIVGGLGNQLFQYAIGRQLALLRKGDLFLDISGFASYRLREFCLPNLSLVYQMADEETIKWHQKRTSRLYPFRRLLTPMNRFTYLKEKSMAYDASVLLHKESVYLEGYWQSQNYFLGIRDRLLTECLPKKINDAAVHLRDQIKKTEGAVSVHVRRGDYVDNKKTHAYHGVCGPEYYKKAAETIRTNILNPHFFVFSDDTPWVRQNMQLPGNTTYIEGNRDYEDLFLMSLCRRHIIANSSFSWWGAWLNASPNKIVIAPKNYYANPRANTRDLLPEEWTKL